MHRFFVPKDWISGDAATLSGEQAHQIGYVLRLRPDDRIILLDGSGWEYEVELREFSHGQVRGNIVRKEKSSREPALRITFYQALLKVDKFEFVLQKGTELGVSAFVPFISERCVVRTPGEAKMERWRKVIQEAAEQSERAVLPVLHPVVDFAAACKNISRPALILWEEEKQRSLKAALRSEPFSTAKSLSMMVGPEGGFPQHEVELAAGYGIQPVSIGRRVVRAETAGLAALSIILYERGEVG